MALSWEESATKTYYEIFQNIDIQELSIHHSPDNHSSSRVTDRGKKSHANPTSPRSPTAHMIINQIDKKLSKVEELTDQLSRSLRRPSSRTLRLIDRALSYLLPFESPKAAMASSAEKRDLLMLLNTHRMHLSPYIDTDRIEWNLRHL